MGGEGKKFSKLIYKWSINRKFDYEKYYFEKAVFIRCLDNISRFVRSLFISDNFFKNIWTQKYFIFYIISRHFLTAPKKTHFFIIQRITQVSVENPFTENDGICFVCMIFSPSPVPLKSVRNDLFT